MLTEIYEVMHDEQVFSNDKFIKFKFQEVLKSHFNV